MGITTSYPDSATFETTVGAGLVYLRGIPQTVGNGLRQTRKDAGHWHRTVGEVWSEGVSHCSFAPLMSIDEKLEVGDR